MTAMMPGGRRFRRRTVHRPQPATKVKPSRSSPRRTEFYSMAWAMPYVWICKAPSAVSSALTPTRAATLAKA